MSSKGWTYAATAAAFSIGMVSAPPARATNGYFENGIGAISEGEAGIGVSSSDAVMAAALNPALGVQAGNTAGGCLSIFMPNRSATVTGTGPAGAALQTGTFNSGEGVFEVPCVGGNFKMGDKAAVSVLLYANGGMNTDYAGNPFSGFHGVTGSTPMGVDLEQVFLQTSYARKIGYGVTLRGGPLLAAQRFQAQGLQPFEAISAHPQDLSNSGYDYSYGAGFRVGALWDAAPWVSAGVSYQSRIWMTNFNKYKGLFADNGNFDIPPAITEGLTFHLSKTLDLAVENEHIFFSSVDSISNPQNNSLSGGPLMGQTGGSGFGWNDMNVYRIGAQWHTTDRLTLRTGYSHATDFTNGANLMFNIISPATIKDHASIGGTYDLTSAWSVSLAYTHAFSKTFSANANPYAPGQTVNLQMDQNDATIGVKYKW